MARRPSIISDIFSTLRRTMPPTSRQSVTVAALVIGDNLDIGPDHGERSAEIVAGVGEEPALAGECPVQPLEHPVKGGGESGDLVIGAFESDAAAQIGSLDVTGHIGDLLHRSEDPARHHPSNDDAQQEKGYQGEDRGSPPR